MFSLSIGFSSFFSHNARNHPPEPTPEGGGEGRVY